MPRPKIPRRVCGRPADSCFKPNARPLRDLPRLELAADEFEAIRLVDLLGLQQQEAAVEMHVSRQTLAILLKSGRFKVADCLAHGKALIMPSAHIDPHSELHEDTPC